jgi:hypothetical protein
MVYAFLFCQICGVQPQQWIKHVQYNTIRSLEEKATWYKAWTIKNTHN